MGKYALKPNTDKVSILFFIVIGFYAVQAIAAFFFPKIMPPLMDFAAAILLLCLAYLLHKKYGATMVVPIFLGIGFFIHFIGLYNIIPYNQYYTGNLYGAPQLNYHYDWIVHSVSMGFFAAAIASIFYPYLKRAFKSDFTVFFFLLLACLGMGLMNEVLEFVGYKFFGVGHGFMEFGEGDISPNAGPWQNSCTDMLNNIIGATVFIGNFILAKRYFWRKKG